MITKAKQFLRSGLRDQCNGTFENFGMEMRKVLPVWNTADVIVSQSNAQIINKSGMNLRLRPAVIVLLQYGHSNIKLTG